MNEAISETGNGFIPLGGELIAAVKAVLAEKLGRPAAEINAEDKLESDLGIDSMTMIEINIGLEERFPLTMPDFTEPGEIGVRKVKDLAAFVAARLADRPVAREVQA
jgi:acyl carrier protein